MFGEKFSKRRVNEDAADKRLSVFKKKAMAAAPPPEKKKGMDAGDVVEGAGKVVERAPAIASGAKTGMALGAKAAPALAAVPVIGPGLAAAAPAVGGALGGAYGAVTGGKGEKTAKEMPKKLKALREEGAKHFDFSKVGKYFSG